MEFFFIWLAIEKATTFALSSVFCCSPLASMLKVLPVHDLHLKDRQPRPGRSLPPLACSWAATLLCTYNPENPSQYMSPFVLPEGIMMEKWVITFQLTKNRQHQFLNCSNKQIHQQAKRKTLDSVFVSLRDFYSASCFLKIVLKIRRTKGPQKNLPEERHREVHGSSLKPYSNKLRTSIFNNKVAIKLIIGHIRQINHRWDSAW